MRVAYLPPVAPPAHELHSHGMAHSRSTGPYPLSDQGSSSSPRSERNQGRAPRRPLHLSKTLWQTERQQGGETCLSPPSRSIPSTTDRSAHFRDRRLVTLPRTSSAAGARPRDGPPPLPAPAPRSSSLSSRVMQPSADTLPNSAGWVRAELDASPTTSRLSNGPRSAPLPFPSPKQHAIKNEQLGRKRAVGDFLASLASARVSARQRTGSLDDGAWINDLVKARDNGDGAEQEQNPLLNLMAKARNLLASEAPTSDRDKQAVSGAPQLPAPSFSSRTVSTSETGPKDYDHDLTPTRARPGAVHHPLGAALGLALEPPPREVTPGLGISFDEPQMRTTGSPTEESEEAEAFRAALRFVIGANDALAERLSAALEAQTDQTASLKIARSNLALAEAQVDSLESTLSRLRAETRARTQSGSDADSLGAASGTASPAPALGLPMGPPTILPSNGTSRPKGAALAPAIELSAAPVPTVSPGKVSFFRALGRRSTKSSASPGGATGAQADSGPSKNTANSTLASPTSWLRSRPSMTGLSASGSSSQLSFGSSPSPSASSEPPLAPVSGSLSPARERDLATLRSTLLVAQNNAARLEKEKRALQDEVEEMSIALFEQANGMVRAEREKAALLERRVEDLERELRTWRTEAERLKERCGALEAEAEVRSKPAPNSAERPSPDEGTDQAGMNPTTARTSEDSEDQFISPSQTFAALPDAPVDEELRLGISVTSAGFASVGPSTLDNANNNSSANLAVSVQPKHRAGSVSSFFSVLTSVSDRDGAGPAPQDQDQNEGGSSAFAMGSDPEGEEREEAEEEGDEAWIAADARPSSGHWPADSAVPSQRGGEVEGTDTSRCRSKTHAAEQPSTSVSTFPPTIQRLTRPRGDLSIPPRTASSPGYRRSEALAGAASAAPHAISSPSDSAIVANRNREGEQVYDNDNEDDGENGSWDVPAPAYHPGVPGRSGSLGLEGLAGAVPVAATRAAPGSPAILSASARPAAGGSASASGSTAIPIYPFSRNSTMAATGTGTGTGTTGTEDDDSGCRTRRRNDNHHRNHIHMHAGWVPPPPYMQPTMSAGTAGTAAGRGGGRSPHREPALTSTSSPPSSPSVGGVRGPGSGSGSGSGRVRMYTQLTRSRSLGVLADPS